MKYRFSFGMFLMFAGVMLTAVAAQARLSIGDPAPKLQTGAWIQGDPVQSYDTNHVYIVEFWATWCAPCRASIPHLNELFQKFKDQGLIAIGQNVWEQDDSSVAPFVQKMAGQMTYRVALDDKTQVTKGVMAATWMDAADQNGIPTAFIVDKHGRIVWIGHPKSLTEKVIADVLADNFDITDYIREYERRQLEEQARQKLETAMNRKIWVDADAAVAVLEQNCPESSRYEYGPFRLQILLGRKDYDGAYKLAKSLAEKDNPGFQNQVAWALATYNGLDQRGLVLAESIAESANHATSERDPQMLDTLARIQFLSGRTNEAVANEQKALDASSDDLKEYLKKTLASYQKGQLPNAN